MNILVTGNLGYIGPVLTEKLEKLGHVPALILVIFQTA